MLKELRNTFLQQCAETLQHEPTAQQQQNINADTNSSSGVTTASATDYLCPYEFTIKYGLDKHQAGLVITVAEHADATFQAIIHKQMPATKPLVAILTGEGGSGKTKVL